VIDEPLSSAMAQTLLKRYPNPDDIPWRPWCYVQGYALCGMIKLWRRTADDRYLCYARRFCDQHTTPKGELLGFKGDSLDDIMAGAVLAEMYHISGDGRYRRAADAVAASFADYPRNADGGFWHSRNLEQEMWIDGVFMGGMFMLRYGAYIEPEGTWFDEVALQVTSMADHCRKGDTGLFLHAYDEGRRATWADPVTGLSPEVWSEGLGWYALILVEALELLPQDHPDRPGILAIWGELADGLRRAQDPATGLWYQVVDKGHLPDNWHDTSGSAMFTYALQRGVELGALDANAYAHVAASGYAGVRTKARPNGEGLIDVYDACDGVCVQDNYEIYINYPQKINAKEAVVGVLWAAVAVENLETCGSIASA